MATSAGNGGTVVPCGRILQRSIEFGVNSFELLGHRVCARGASRYDLTVTAHMGASGAQSARAVHCFDRRSIFRTQAHALAHLFTQKEVGDEVRARDDRESTASATQKSALWMPRGKQLRLFAAWDEHVAELSLTE